MWFSVTITSMFTQYLDKRTTDSVAIYLLPEIYNPVEIGGTTDPFLAHWLKSMFALFL